MSNHVGGRQASTEPVGRLLRRPGAWLPIALSALALAVVLGYAAMFGVTQPQPHDEGAAARLFQLILLADALTIGLFAIRWLPRAPRQATLILVLQLATAAIPMATVVILESRI
jgi:hypothetical protein